MDECKAKIREFLLRYIRKHDLKDEDDFFAMGFVNSLFAMQLVTFLEQQFCITIDDDDLEIENFRSINVIAALVGRKTDPID
ncbi:MAG: acyl carrier protein [Blastocatellia bacterium]